MPSLTHRLPESQSYGSDVSRLQAGSTFHPKAAIHGCPAKRHCFNFGTPRHFPPLSSLVADNPASSPASDPPFQNLGTLGFPHLGIHGQIESRRRMLGCIGGGLRGNKTTIGWYGTAWAEHAPFWLCHAQTNGVGNVLVCKEFTTRFRPIQPGPYSPAMCPW